jgi:hypothetical protein
MDTNISMAEAYDATNFEIDWSNVQVYDTPKIRIDLGYDMDSDSVEQVPQSFDWNSLQSENTSLSPGYSSNDDMTKEDTYGGKDLWSIPQEEEPKPKLGRPRMGEVRVHIETVARKLVCEALVSTFKLLFSFHCYN